MMNAECPHCRGAVALHEGMPKVTADGAVALWHRACWDRRQRPIVATRIAVESRPVPVAARRRTSRRVSLVFAGAALVAIVVARWAWFQLPPAAASLANVDFTVGETLDPPNRGTANEVLPPRPAGVETLLEATWEIPALRDGTPLDDAYPSLVRWTHPVTASAELIPTQPSRLFGVPRAGVDNPRPECGEGHCGIDLDGPRGRPIVAVAAGKAVRVERHENGLDNRSGKYVRIEHDDGTLSAYMHLDDIADDLEVGDRVRAGQYIGTLGATAVYSAPPHLHFSLEIPNHRGTHGDNSDTHFINPAPFLVRSSIVATPDR